MFIFTRSLLRLTSSACASSSASFHVVVVFFWPAAPLPCRSGKTLQSTLSSSYVGSSGEDAVLARVRAFGELRVRALHLL
jgi:hypothetical protein